VVKGRRTETHGKRSKVNSRGECFGMLKCLAHTIYSKRSSEYFDPCQEFANKSIKCLHRNGGDKEMCTDYFQ
jgi:hypothetical protein